MPLSRRSAAQVGYFDTRTAKARALLRTWITTVGQIEPVFS
jgi:hypothetical protein